LGGHRTGVRRRGDGLVAYGAERLGVFSQTAELLSRRARAEDSQSHRPSGDRVMRDDAKEIRRESYWEIAREIYSQAPGGELEDKSREELRAALGAFSCAARMGHPAASREAALITLHLDGNGSERVRDLLLQASASGYTLAAYNLGGLQGADLPPGEQRDALLAWARKGAQVAAFIVGAMDASAVDDDHQLRPAAVKATQIPRSDWKIIDGAAEAPLPDY
jgi:hypothetical protein